MNTQPSKSRGRAKPVTAEDIQQMFALRSRGLKNADIAREMHLVLSTVQRHMHIHAREFKASLKGATRNGSQPIEQSLVSEAWFKLGQLYRAFKGDLADFATQPGCPLTLDEITLRLGDTLRAEGAQIRKELRGAELLHEMRTDGAPAGGARQTERGGDVGTATPDLHVRPRSQRSLSAKARASIAAGQRRRWAKQKREARAALVKMAPSKRKEYSKAQKSYWAKMTPAERSAEIKRRQKVAAEKKAAA